MHVVDLGRFRQVERLLSRGGVVALLEVEVGACTRGSWGTAGGTATSHTGKQRARACVSRTGVLSLRHRDAGGHRAACSGRLHWRCKRQ